MTQAVPLVGNQAIEDAAMAYVLGLERTAGRRPVDRRHVAAFPSDIESPPRIIEVKAAGAITRGTDLRLKVAQVEGARCNPESRLYLIDNAKPADTSKFKLRILGDERLARLRARAHQRRCFEVPAPHCRA